MEKPCPTYPEFSANEEGEIFRNGSKQEPAIDKWTGYEKLRCYVNGDFKSLKVHLLVCDAFLGPRPKNCTVDHLNGDRSDNRLSNLRYATVEEQSANRDFSRVKKERDRTRQKGANAPRETWLEKLKRIRKSS